MNPNPQSVSRPRENPCYGSDQTVAALNVITDDERSHLLPYAQFLYAEMSPNPALEKDINAPTEHLRICFATAEVVVLGRGLKSVEWALQRYELRFLKAADRRYLSALKSHICGISINPSKEVQ